MRVMVAGDSIGGQMAAAALREASARFYAGRAGFEKTPEVRHTVGSQHGQDMQ